MNDSVLTLRRDENQARGIGQYAIDFLSGKLGEPSAAVLNKVEQFHLDSVACGVSALACGTNAPRVLREEAFEYATNSNTQGVPCFGSRLRVMPEKAVLANSSAVREWDSNGTNFGYNPARGATRGEFGHNDFYPVAIAAAQLAKFDGRQTLRGMLLLDEIRGRLAEVFALKNYKIDHVVHGAIASAATYGAMLGATAEQIESAIGLVVAHYIPFRAIRHGKQLSDSKGASAAISAEMAVTSMRRSMRGFVGPADIFRNAEGIFCLFEKPAAKNQSPFDLTLSTRGDDFAIMGMHFKLGLYEHQSAGAIGGLIDLLTKQPQLLSDVNTLRAIRITIYEPAYSIIGDPAKRDPRTRQSADHSMVYIIATLLRKALEQKSAGWRELMLVPADYDEAALYHPTTRTLIDRIEFRHGGDEYDAKYPDGIPTTLEIEHDQLGSFSSGLVMYPEGHARNTSGNLDALLAHKFRTLAALGVADVDALYRRFTGMADKSVREIAELYDFEILGLRAFMIRVEGLTKRFGTKHGELVAVDNLSFSVSDGEVYGLLGPNGAGKTTTLRMILGLLPSDAGYAEVVGFRSSIDTDEVKRRVGFVSASAGLYPWLSPRELVLFFADLYGMSPADAQRRLDELARIFDIVGFLDQRCSTLSSGQQQRVHLVRALVHDPPVMLLDEPTRGLDVFGSQVIFEYVAHLREQGKSVIVSTHQLDEAQRLCDRFGLMHRGRLVREGNLATLRETTGCDSLVDMFLQVVPAGAPSEATA